MPRKVFTDADITRASHGYSWTPHPDWIVSVKNSTMIQKGVHPPDELVIYVYRELIVSATGDGNWVYSCEGRCAQLMEEEAGSPPFEAGDDVE